MSTSIGIMPSANAAFARLIDYAGLFPPAKLAMLPSLDEYAVSRAGGFSWMLGRFITPASRIDELLSSLPSSGSVVPLSVIVDADSDPRRWLTSAQAVFAAIAGLRKRGKAVAVEALEVPLPRLLSQRESFDATIGQTAMLAESAGLRDLPMYVEFPRDERTASMLGDAMHALKRYRLHAKIRCGGVVPSAFPSSSELATFIFAASQAGIAFKATAGLHHPVRHDSMPLGVKMHGFLNILAAAAIAPDAHIDTLAQILDEERPQEFRFEPEAFIALGRRFALDEIARARTSFAAYGSCSFSEPVGDLTALSILPR
ncbi:MAG: hypothetical protein M3N13_02505 [Candidatus Eremiobacteraeota bacterium]|nr:hypothetical protein [Candidatus Eremiobacteraeota bacterium]